MAGVADSGARRLVLVHQIYVLLQVASLVEAHRAALVLALERLLLSMDSQVGVELAYRPEHLVTRPLLLLW